jgi:tRNA-splicing ligase RtcB
MAITAKQLISLGYITGPSIGIAMKIVGYATSDGMSDEGITTILVNILTEPKKYLETSEDPLILSLASSLLPKEIPNDTFELVEQKPYKIYGVENIEQGALDQMNIAMRLPITVAGAVMPDSHLGYSLPIGGVLATNNVVSPASIGNDVSCMMKLTIYDIKPSFLTGQVDKLKNSLLACTNFGTGGELEKPVDDEVLENRAFSEIPLLKSLHNKAVRQLSSSGNGNHFVEIGVVNITDISNEFGLPIGEYVGILSHSGSRGLGANIAKYYTKLAMEKCKLPKEAKSLAWLDLNKQEGQEYWISMLLAGDYATACHAHIHKRLSKYMGWKEVGSTENRHNFAWKEQHNGQEVIVHRKGATPAGKGVLGIIPGSMATPAYIVRGKGEPESLNSASHGAGRLMSRTAAKNSITMSSLRKLLKEEGVELIGSGVDEAPGAYKDINKVMGYQTDLVDILGTFHPKVVRMSEEKGDN